jgi:hypothetical protein
MAGNLIHFRKQIIMNTERNDRNQNRDNNDSTSKPDAGTLHNTDPQENMKGPVSSITHGAGEQFDTEETKDEADREKDRKM